MTRPRPAPAPPPPRLTGINWDGSPYCFNCVAEIFGADIFSRPPAPPLAPILGGVYVCARCDFDAVAGWYDGPRPGPGPRPAPRPRPRPVIAPAPGPGCEIVIYRPLATTERHEPAPGGISTRPPRPVISKPPGRPARPPALRGGWLLAGWRDERISPVQDLPATPPGPVEPIAPPPPPRAGWGYHNWTPAELAWLKQWKQEQDAGLAAFMKEPRAPSEYKGRK